MKKNRDLIGFRLGSYPTFFHNLTPLIEEHSVEMMQNRP
jgi:hypothetical protein